MPRTCQVEAVTRGVRVRASYIWKGTELQVFGDAPGPVVNYFGCRCGLPASKSCQ